MAWTDLRALHDPKPGLPIPSAWGDAVNGNFAVFSEREAARVVTNQSTSSTSFTDLATVGPAVTAVTGTKALCLMTMQVGPSVDVIVSIAVSGATTIAANADNADNALIYTLVGGNWSGFGYFTTLNPGSNTFTVKYSVTGGTSSFLRRRLLVVPLS